MIVSNVPGPRQRGRIASAVVSEIELGGSARRRMNITVWGYADELNISVFTNDLTLDEPECPALARQRFT